MIEGRSGGGQIYFGDWTAKGVRFQSALTSHRILKYLADEEIVTELTNSKALIEQNIGDPVDIFCYPNARYPSGKSELYSKCGYRLGVKIDNEFLTPNTDRYHIFGTGLGSSAT